MRTKIEKEPKENDTNTLFVKGIPFSASNEDLAQVFSEIGPLKQCFVVANERTPEKNRGFGYVTFALQEDTEAALKATLSLLDLKLTVLPAKKKRSMEERMAKKRSSASFETETDSPVVKKFMTQGTRLIVRNLSFACTLDHLRSRFEDFGKVKDVRMPKKKSGAFLGFGIVHFEQHADAVKAMQEMNEATIEGRVVAVDWCLPKDTYLQNQGPEITPETTREKKKVDAEERAAKRKAEKKRKKEKKRKEQNEAHAKVAPQADAESHPSTRSSSSSSPTAAVEASNERKWDGEEKALHTRTPDVSENTTLFLRNVPSDCTKGDLLRIFKPFGMVVYVAIQPSNTGSNGTAFVCFATKEAAQACLDRAVPIQPNTVVQPEVPEDYPFKVHEEVLAVHLAVPKTHPTQKKDPRNLVLLHEVPEALVPQMKQKLQKSVDFIVSPTRLLFQHLPKTCTKQQLRDMALQPFHKLLMAPQLKQVVLVKGDFTKNKGFGFVEFLEPHPALTCVRAFRDGKVKTAPIDVAVSFAVENRRILGLREHRIQLQKEKKHTTKPVLKLAKHPKFAKPAHAN